ncbi:MAG: 6-phosphofructokinase [Oscillospiraceae bacterium]|nr:6-phosphofructokinase [Oscillospiraceae bacterium]
MRSIGVLTSGGDAPGMNAAVRSVVRCALAEGFKVYGIYDGYNGLINGKIEEMTVNSVSNIINKGGTAIYTARCLEFKDQEGVLKGKETCEKLGIEGLVVIGGDGSFRGAADLSSAGINCVGIPGTIDNDITCTDYTIGYDTAMNTVVDLIDKLRDTCNSHARCSVVEVMGRRCGDLALNAGLAGGATAIVVPEIPFDFEKDILAKVVDAKNRGKHNFIVVVAEGIGGSAEISKKIEEATGIETRAAILAHIQRGGAPSAKDRIVASRMGKYAVDLLKNGIGNRVVAMKGNDIVDYNIHEALKMKKSIDQELFKLADLIK